MEENTKKELWKVFSIAAFLFITVFFILPYLVQISTFFHERAHQKELDRFEIKNSYNINLLETIPNFYNPNVNKLGVTKFDLDAYFRLDKTARTEINTAGIISDLRFLFLIGVYMAFVNVYIFYKVWYKKDFNLTWSLAVNWILFMWLLALIQITVANITYSGGDVYMLVNYLKI